MLAPSWFPTDERELAHSCKWCPHQNKKPKPKPKITSDSFISPVMFHLLFAIGPRFWKSIMNLLYIVIFISINIFLHSTEIYEIPPFILIYMVCTVTQEIILSPSQRWRNLLKYREHQWLAVVKACTDSESRTQIQFPESKSPSLYYSPCPQITISTPLRVE